MSVVLIGIVDQLPLTSIAAAVFLGGASWYWLFLARPGVPAARRRTRRISLVFMSLLAVDLALAIDVLDSGRDPTAWLVAWAAAILLLVLVVVIAVLDAVMTLHAASAERHEATIEAIIETQRDINSDADADADGGGEG